MPLSAAPFHADLSEGPADSRAWWVRASDGLRLRVAHFPTDGDMGTVLLFPGRTEYVEKYGRTAAVLSAAGYHVLTVDWRGQGLADRMLPEPLTGHVQTFEDYQKDVAAMLEAVSDLDLPRPFHMIAHSMGGAIGLRAAMEGLPIASCVFTGPMWGIQMTSPTRPAAWALSWGGSRMGLGHVVSPGTSPESYVAVGAFENNTLTTDPDMWDYMRRQVLARPELQLGGPSLNWLHEALAECRELSRRPAPALPCSCYVGSNERIVDLGRIEARMKAWPGGTLVRIDGGEHEILMEKPATRARVLSEMVAQFNRTGRAGIALTA